MDVRTTRVSGLERLWAERVEQSRVRETPTQGAQRESTRVKISDRAEMLSQISTLQKNDPERFKEVLGSVSANLTAAANPGSGEVGNDLGKLARSLQQVARTGDLTRLGALSPASPQSANRAIEAYLKNARPPTAQPTETSRQALQYVMSTIAEANQDVQPAAAATSAEPR